MSTKLTRKESKINCWLEWFESRESFDIVNKGFLEKLFETFDHSLTTEDCKEALLEHPESVFMIRVPFRSSRVVLFHHMMKDSSTFYDSDTGDHYSFLQGLGASMTFPMMPDVDLLCKHPTTAAIQTPTPTQILNCLKEDEIDALTDSASVTFKPRNSIPVLPFLVYPIHESIRILNGDPKKVLLACITAIKSFDADHASDSEYKEKAKSKCKDILLWTFLVLKDNNAIKEIPSLACDSEKLIASFEKLSKANLSNDQEKRQVHFSSEVEQSLQRPFEVLAATTSSTSDFLEKLTQIQASNNDKAAKSFKKIPAKYQNMLLVASSVGDVTELDYSSEASEFPSAQILSMLK